jgi:murein DD-endopeptidase MepM/ murein hydrolase activator NlpD
LDVNDRIRQLARALGRQPRRTLESVRREPLLWSAGSLAILIAAVAILSNGRAAPTVPLSVAHGIEQSRMASTARATAMSQAMANLPEPSPATPSPAPKTTAAAPTAPAMAATLPQTAVWPLQGRIAMGFGWVYDSAGGYWFYHTGWEIEAKPGAEVHAALPGSVAAVERESSGSLTVVVRSPQQVVTTYTGISSTPLAVGAAVGQGQTIGTLTAASGGKDGRLGFSITRAGQPVNPSTMLKPATAGASRQG